MPRFSDDWVVDRTMFEYVSGGSCACCGFSHLLYPDGVPGMIHSISDLETDAAQAEVSALSESPWPPEMREQVWADRIRLRHKLKKEMEIYQKFWQEHGDAFVHWCREEASPKLLAQLLQMPRHEVTERVNSQYGIHSAFAVVLCAVVEQVVHFEATKYPTDGRGNVEMAFEKALLYDRRGGFTLNILNKDDSLNEDVWNIWLERMKNLGGPKLLERGPTSSTQRKDDEEDDDEEGGADEAQERDPESSSQGPSFRSDRRIVRLLVARYWADQFIKKYQSEMAKKKAPTEESSKKEEAAEMPSNADE